MEKIYEKNLIKEFEIKILSSRECDSFIPMSFVNIENCLSVTYYTQGYTDLTRVKIKNPYELMDILEKLVLKMKRGENHFILNNRYDLKMQNIFVKQGGSDIKIMFIPMDEGCSTETKEFSEKIEVLLCEMLEQLDNLSCCEYAEMIIRKVGTFNLSKQTLINYLGELKREAYICGWE